MSKWDKANKKLDEILETLTHEQWVDWDSQKDANSINRRKNLVTQGQIQEKELFVEFEHVKEPLFCFSGDFPINYFSSTDKINNPSNISRGYLFLVTSQHGVYN